MASADVFDGLTAEIKNELREFRAEIRRDYSRTIWMAGIAAGLEGVAAAGTVAILIYLLFAQP